MFSGAFGLAIGFGLQKTFGNLIAGMILLMDRSIKPGDDGRMDMMSASLGVVGIALFLATEHQSYSKALFFGCIATAASTFTHPIGGILATVNLGIAALLFSNRRLRWWHVALAAFPYLICVAGWSIYIAQAPDVFRAQFFSISGGRLSAWKQPVSAVVKEFQDRWASPFHLFDGFGAKNLKAFTFAVYAASVGWAILRWKKVRLNGFGLIFSVVLADLFVLCFAEGTKNGAYLIHSVPWLAALSALPIALYWRKGGAVIFTLFLIVQLVGSVYVISRFQYQREYSPAIAFLRKEGKPVDGVAELGFGLGFQPGLTDDHRLGYYTGKDPQLVVMDHNYDDYYHQYQRTDPEIYRYIHGKLSTSRVIFENPLYRIYLRGK